MYKNWDNQKRVLLDVISKGQSATAQVCVGTNYSIFFRNIHSDLLLKKNVLPVYVDSNHVQFYSPINFKRLVLLSIKRAMVEKRLISKADVENLSEIETAEKIVEHLADAYSRGLGTVLFVEDAQILLKNGTETFAFLEELKRKSGKCSIVYLNSVNIMHPTTYSKLTKLPHLFENVIYMPMRDEKYLRSIEKGTSPKIFKTIYDLTGGIDSFYSVAMDLKNTLAPRERKNIVKYIHDNWHLRREVNRLWDSFSESEVKALAAIVWGVTEFEDILIHDLKHLESLGIIERTKNGYKLVIGLLRKFGVEKAEKLGLKVEYEKNKILVNGRCVPMKLSEDEKTVLKHFLTNKNRIIARALIAKSLNGRGKNVDEAVSNLKTKLSHYWINPKNLVQVENKGFIYRE